MKPSLIPATCRAARSLLDWTQHQLAQKAGVGITTVRTFEKGATKTMPQNLVAIERALVAGGILFIPENGGGVGVRLRTPSST